jgi:radical SAM superfamily enzyme YgiQ (UPF0313 family)/nucleoside-diphosphate-sugar epimerase
MKAALVFPGITMKGWNSFGRMSESEANYVPHGLAYIAACAKVKGHNIEVLDLRKMKDWEDFRNEVLKRSPGVFGVSSMSVDFGIAVEAVKIIKDINKDSITILGGVHATVATDEVMGIPEIDHIVTGEGELVFANILESLAKKEQLPKTIRGNSPDINDLPYPDREIFDFKKGEMKNPWLPHMPIPFVSIITSRGCPFKCTFCQPAERAVFGGKARFRDAENVIDELKVLREKYRFRSLLIHDDLFTFNKNWVLEFCRKYRENGFEQIFTCQARADFITKNEDVVREMRESGLSCFMIGFESGSQRILDFIQKGATIEQNRRAVEICHKYGIKIFANYMFGLPTETPEEVFSTVDFIKWARPEYPSPAFFTPHPGSYLYDYCKENNLSLIDSYSGYARNPTEPKIKGMDYEFLSFAVKRSTDYKIDEELDRIKKRRFTRIFLKSHEASLKAKKMELSSLDKYYRERIMKLHAGKKRETKRVLVTGGTGFIGSALVHELIDKGYQTTVLTRNSKSEKAKTLAAKGVGIIQGDVEDKRLIPKIKGFSIIFHLAIFPGVVGEKMFDVNVGGTENLLMAAVEGKTELFIYASSIEAQGTGKAEDIPLKEEDQCNPVSDYGRSKLEAEKKVIEYENAHGLKAMIARIGNVYGIGSGNFVYPIIEAIFMKNPLLVCLPLFNERLIQPIYINDLVGGLLKMIEKEDKINETYNFTGNNPITAGRWFQVIAAFLKREKILEQYINRTLSEDSTETAKELHPAIKYFLSGDKPYIHRAYTDEKLRRAIGDYEHFNILKGTAYTIEWLYKNGLLKRWI